MSKIMTYALLIMLLAFSSVTPKEDIYIGKKDVLFTDVCSSLCLYHCCASALAAQYSSLIVRFSAQSSASIEKAWISQHNMSGYLNWFFFCAQESYREQILMREQW